MAELNINVEKTQTEEISIKVVDHPEFEGDIKTMLLSSTEMCEKISAYFGAFFFDYAGCKIRINDGRNPAVASFLPQGAIYVDLYFKDMGKVSEDVKIIKNIIPMGKKEDDDGTKKDTLLSRYMRVNGARNGRAYTVTADTFKTLNSITNQSLSNGRWMERTQELITNYSIYGKEEIVVCITGIDLNKILSEIYGVRDEDGHYEYSASPSTVIPSSYDEFIIQVSQLRTELVSSLRAKLGMYNASSPSYHSWKR